MADFLSQVADIANPVKTIGKAFKPDTQRKVARLERKAARGNMRAQQKLMAMEAFKESRKKKDEPGLSPAEMQAAATVSQDVGAAAGQALLQGQMPGQTFSPDAMQAGMSTGADIAAGQQKNILDTIRKVDEAKRRERLGLVERGGESQWRQNMAEVELAMKGVSAAAAAV